MEYQYDSKKYGKEYMTELNKVMDIRKDRRLIYGDSFKDEKIENLLAIIDGKQARLKQVIKMASLKHPKARDEISDIINYLVFLLHKITELENGTSKS